MTKIYISSTYEDLKEYREAAYKLLNKVPGREIHAMEDYVAGDKRPLDKCLADVNSCDIYIGIFAFRYGYIPLQGNPDKRSITELEYREATKTGKERLIFLTDENTDWRISHTDYRTGEGERGRKIEDLRKELGENHTASFFKTPDQLAGLVSAAVMNWEKKQAPSADLSAPKPETQVQFRELRNSLLLAYSPADETLARQVAQECGAWVERPILLSPTALFVEDEQGFLSLEGSAIHCCAGLVLLTPTSFDQLKTRSKEVKKVLTLMQDRLGSMLIVLAGISSNELPSAWKLNRSVELSLPLAGDASLAVLKKQVLNSMPVWGKRLVGLPVSILAMNRNEIKELEENPDIVGEQLGIGVQTQYLKIKQELSTAGIDWTTRYSDTRSAWQPFGPDTVPAFQIIDEVVTDLNKRNLPKLRDRLIKIQWYPFDALVEQGSGNDLTLRRVYQSLAQAGCVLLVDELSLFHPVLRQALISSPFFNREQVAIVTLSPFNPGLIPLNQLLESETRKKLADAFNRYAMDYDPQCELAVGDVRQLKRWLHSSLQETVLNYRDPKPDQEAMRAFYESELGPDTKKNSGDYPWAGESHS